MTDNNFNCFNIIDSEECYKSKNIKYSKFIFYSENCEQSIHCSYSRDIKGCVNCHKVYNSKYCGSCVRCEYCYKCNYLTDKMFYYKNEPMTHEHAKDLLDHKAYKRFIKYQKYINYLKFIESHNIS